MSRLIKSFLLITLFFTLTTFNTNNQKKVKGIFFEIKNIIIEDTNSVDLIKLKADLEFLRGASLFFLDEKKSIKYLLRRERTINSTMKPKYLRTSECIS